jgi:hypothetical protein
MRFALWVKFSPWSIKKRLRSEPPRCTDEMAGAGSGLLPPTTIGLTQPDDHVTHSKPTRWEKLRLLSARAAFLHPDDVGVVR